MGTKSKCHLDRSAARASCERRQLSPPAILQVLWPSLPEEVQSALWEAVSNDASCYVTGPLAHLKKRLPASTTHFCDAERLLKYAAEIGIDVTPETRGAILRAYQSGLYRRPGPKRSPLTFSLRSPASPPASSPLPPKASKPTTTTPAPPSTTTSSGPSSWPASSSPSPSPPSSPPPSLQPSATTCSRQRPRRKAPRRTGPSASPRPDRRLPSQRRPVNPTSSPICRNYASIVRVINARSRKLNHFVLPRQRLPLRRHRHPRSSGRSSSNSP